MQEFNFSYLTNKIKATIDDTTLFAKIGPIIKKEILLESIEFFYIKEYNDYNELIIRYRKSNGKIINQKMIFAHNSIGAIELANALSQRFPEKDLRGKAPHEAMKLLKAADSQKIGFILAVVIMLAVVTVIFMPYLIHYFDNGHENVSVENVIAGEELFSRNLTMSGYVVNEGMWLENTSTDRGSTTITTNNYFPIVEKSWEIGDPIHIISKTGDLSQAEVDEFVYSTSFTGTLRNVWWEGIGSDVTEFLITNYSHNIAEDVVLFEINDGNPDKYVLYIYIFVIVILLVVFGIVALKQRKKNKI